MHKGVPPGLEKRWEQSIEKWSEMLELQFTPVIQLMDQSDH